MVLLTCFWWKVFTQQHIASYLLVMFVSADILESFFTAWTVISTFYIKNIFFIQWMFMWSKTCCLTFNLFFLLSLHWQRHFVKRQKDNNFQIQFFSSFFYYYSNWTIPLGTLHFFCLINRRMKEKMLLAVNGHLIDTSDSPLPMTDRINVLLWLWISKTTVGPLLLHTYTATMRDRKWERNTNKVSPEHYKTSPPLIFCLV